MMSRLKRLVNKTYTAAEIAKMFNVEHITVRRWIKKINLDVKKPVMNGSLIKSILKPLKITDWNYLNVIMVMYWR